MSARKNLIRMSVVIIILLFYILLDLILGCFFLKKDEIRISDPYFHHGLKPMSQKSSEWGGRNYRLVTNSLGFKDSSNRDIEKKAGMKRIMFLGDSFTEGLGYDFDSTFTGIIANDLKGKYEVLNGGVTSYSPKLYLLRTEHLINSGYEFDHIVLMLDISDIQDEVIYENFIPERKISLLKSVDVKLSNTFFSYSYFFRGIIKKLLNSHSGSGEDSILEQKISDRGLWTYDEKCFAEWGEKGLYAAEISMKKLSDLCRNKKIKLTMAVYPWPEQMINDTVESKQVIFWKGFCLENNIDFIDLFPYFFEDECRECTVKKYFIEGDCHWNYDGHELIAEKILERIK
ncbi:TPA: hypothetical protein DCR49_06215 [Candidatus Delongbacteria bacterium]|nr:MAG: hypothetical protein A2Y39_00260 [Candidatus Delongbacteria bacterium GWF2_40_14]HAQ61579.1 hypothetical protein [Candidatus Delongbacteria bacterium]